MTLGVWSVAWLGVGSVRPSFLSGYHFLFSVGEWGKGIHNSTEKLKEAQKPGGTHRKNGEEGSQQLTRWYVRVRKCFLIQESSGWSHMK